MTILPENNRQLLDIAFRKNLGYFTGNYATVYKTEDFGATWNQILMEQSLASNAFYAVNIMENKTYMIYNTILGYRFFFTEDQIHWSNYEWGDVDFGRKGLFFLNDNQGYYSYTFDGLIAGNSNENDNGYIPVIRETTFGEQAWLWHDMSIDWWSMKQGQYPANPLYLDICFVNDTQGYAIFGQSLLRFPKPVSQKIRNIHNDNILELFQISEDEIFIKSTSHSILSIDIYDISGKKIINKKWQNPIPETSINIHKFPQSIYLIKIVTENNVVSISKYIRK